MKKRNPTVISLLKKLEEKGVKIANVTLHVGIGTFRPVKVEKIEDHHMHSEHFYIKQEDVEKINETKKARMSLLQTQAPTQTVTQH